MRLYDGIVEQRREEQSRAKQWPEYQMSSGNFSRQRSSYLYDQHHSIYDDELLFADIEIAAASVCPRAACCLGNLLPSCLSV